jgi:hypothetical protein
MVLNSLKVTFLHKPATGVCKYILENTNGRGGILAEVIVSEKYEKGMEKR